MKLCLLILSILLLCGCANNLFYHPRPQFYDHPAKHNIPMEDVHFLSTNGTKLHGWWFPAATEQEVKGTVLHFHGNAVNVSAHYQGSVWLTRHGYQVFIFDYAGYGKSEGKVSRAQLIRDSQAAIHYVRQRDDVDPERLFYLGQSLGGMAAINGAARTQLAPKGYIIDSTFSEHRAIAADKLLATPGGWVLRPFLFLFVSGTGDPLDLLPKLPSAPILFLHGTADRVIGHRHSEILFEAAAEPKELMLIKDGRHTQGFRDEKVRKRVLKFMDTKR